jgi:Nitrate/nitrite transporter
MDTLSSQGFRGNIPKLYVFRVLGDFMLWTPVIVLFFQENGLNLTQVLLLQSLYSISQIVLEIPSGYLADRKGRRISLIAGAVFGALGMSAYVLGSGFWEFLLGELVMSVAGALQSGSASALAFDSLKQDSREDEFTKIKGRMKSSQLISGAAASLVGGLVAEQGLRLTIWYSIPPLVLMVPLALSLRETGLHEKSVRPGYADDLRRVANTVLRNKPDLRYVILFSAFVGTSTHVAYFLYQPYMREVGTPLAWFGAIIAGARLLTAAISSSAHRIEDKVGMGNSLKLVVVTAVLGFALLGSLPSRYAFAFIALHQLVQGLMGPVISDYVNQLTDSADRATVLSIKNLLKRVVYSLTIPLIGRAADLIGTVQTMTLIAVALSAAALPLYLLLDRHGVLGS